MTRLSLSVLMVVVLTWLAPSTARAANGTSEGERLFVMKGCLGCHGASGRGGVGPDLGGTKLSFDDVLKQLRHPRQRMPAFPSDAVSDDDAKKIYEYLKAVSPAPPRLIRDLPHGQLDPDGCIDCHAKYEPVIVEQFKSSAMGMPGKQNPRVVYPLDHITCANCHGVDHDKIMADKGRVSEAVCGGCHAQIYQEHVLDKGHSYGPGPAGVGINWERNIGVPNYEEMPRKVMETGCDVCHSQAGATDDRYWSAEEHQYVDGSSLPYRNGCIGCHTRHSFSLVEARKPEACHTCHMGPDHPNYEAYMASKHGSIYAARGAGWDFGASMTDTKLEAPTCAYCHMLTVRDDGTRITTHDLSRKIIWGMGTQAAGGQLEDLSASPENQKKRTEMVRVCMTCHSEDRAREYLATADAHKLAGDALVIEGRDILAGLYRDGLIEPSHAKRSAGLLPGPRFTALDVPGGFVQHWPAGLYFDVSSIELEYFDMFFFSNLKSYKGAFHMAPDYAWWYGYADSLGHLARIRDDAEKLRAERATQKRTRFMLFTGPLMVLAVGFAALAAARLWRRRKRKHAV
jgi:hypothetical protein